MYVMSKRFIKIYSSKDKIKFYNFVQYNQVTTNRTY